MDSILSTLNLFAQFGKGWTRVWNTSPAFLHQIIPGRAKPKLTGDQLLTATSLRTESYSSRGQSIGRSMILPSTMNEKASVLVLDGYLQIGIQIIRNDPSNRCTGSWTDFEGLHTQGKSWKRFIYIYLFIHLKYISKNQHYEARKHAHDGIGFTSIRHGCKRHDFPENDAHWPHIGFGSKETIQETLYNRSFSDVIS
jgi:hypothetical protein